MSLRGKDPPKKPGQKAIDNRPVLNFTKPQKFVTIIAGQGQSAENFVVHKALITYHSVFFRSAFKSNFNEGITGSMRLEHVTSEAFGFVNHWLYFQKLPDSQIEHIQLETLAKVWMAAERFKMHVLQNHVSDILCDLLVKRDSTSKDDELLDMIFVGGFQDYLACIKHIYFSTPAGEHKLKSLFLDIFHCHQVSYADRIEEFPIAFCQDVVRRLKTAIPTSQRTWPASNKSRFMVEEDEN